MNASRPTRASGAALLVLLAVISLGGSWYLVSRLNAESGSAAAVRKQRDAEVLNRAKQALIGYVAAQAANSGEDNPGALPCPEAAGYFDNPANEGQTASSCTLPKVGRFPWRTIGTEKLLDSSGEPLWYVVSPGWAATTSGGKTNINSNTLGQLTVDGTPNAAVALIIAPGPAFSVPACGAFATKVQVRPTTGTPDWSNYLECENSNYPTPDATFVTRGTSGSFNDQVIVITVADIMPGVEAAVTKRIERDIVPVLKTVYADANWGTSSASPAFPFPAPFGDPTTSTYLGQAGLYQGLLPFNYHSGSCGADTRCSTDALTWGTPSLSTSGGPGFLPSAPSCYTSGSTPICEGYYYGGTLSATLADPVNGITTGLRTFSGSNATGFHRAWEWTGSAWTYLGQQSTTGSRNLAATGALNFNSSATLPSVPGWGYYYIAATSRPVSADFGDHAILSSSNADTGWFARNEWYRLLYYAIASGHAPGGSLSCTSGTNCLQVSNFTDPAKQRAILVLAGRTLPNLAQTRPSSALQNYLDSAENRNGDTLFVQSAAGRTSNDRFISLSKNP